MTTCRGRHARTREQGVSSRLQRAYFRTTGHTYTCLHLPSIGLALCACQRTKPQLFTKKLRCVISTLQYRHGFLLYRSTRARFVQRLSIRKIGAELPRRKSKKHRIGHLGGREIGLGFCGVGWSTFRIYGRGAPVEAVLAPLCASVSRGSPIE